MKDPKKFTTDLKMPFLTVMSNDDLSSLLEYTCNSLGVLKKYQSSPFDSEVSYHIMMLQIAIFEEMRYRLTSPSDNDD